MQAEFGGFSGEGGIGWTGDLHLPSSLGQALAKGQALVVGPAPTQAGVKLQNPGDQGRGGHVEMIAISACRGQMDWPVGLRMRMQMIIEYGR